MLEAKSSGKFEKCIQNSHFEQLSFAQISVNIFNILTAVRANSTVQKFASVMVILNSLRSALNISEP